MMHKIFAVLLLWIGLSSAVLAMPVPEVMNQSDSTPTETEESSEAKGSSDCD